MSGTQPADDGPPAPLGWSGQVAACRADGTVEVPVTDTDGNTVGVLRLTPGHAEALADMLAEATAHLDATARMTEAETAEAWLAAQPRRPITDLPLPDEDGDGR